MLLCTRILCKINECNDIYNRQNICSIYTKQEKVLSDILPDTTRNCLLVRICGFLMVDTRFSVVVLHHTVTE